MTKTLDFDLRGLFPDESHFNCALYSLVHVIRAQATDLFHENSKVLLRTNCLVLSFASLHQLLNKKRRVLQENRT